MELEMRCLCWPLSELFSTGPGSVRYWAGGGNHQLNYESDTKPRPPDRQTHTRTLRHTFQAHCAIGFMWKILESPPRYSNHSQTHSATFFPSAIHLFRCHVLSTKVARSSSCHSLVVTPMKWPKLIFVLMGSIQTCVVEHGYLEST